MSYSNAQSGSVGVDRAGDIPGDFDGGLRLCLAKGGLHVGVKNPWEPVQTVSNNQTPRLSRQLHVKNGEAGILTTQVSKLIDWGRSASLWPVSFGLACCGIEMMSTSAARFAISGFVAEGLRASPHQADRMT